MLTGREDKADSKLANAISRHTYITETLANETLQPWERKELEELETDYAQEIKKLEQHVNFLNEEYGVGNW